MEAPRETGNASVLGPGCVLGVEDIAPRKSLLGLWMGPLTERPMACWLTVVVVPLAVFAGATWHDGRLTLGSVTTSLEVAPDVLASLRPDSLSGAGHEVDLLGISFLGDTMVWPFVLLVPALLHLLLLVVHRTVRFFEQAPDALNPEWMDTPPNQRRYRAIFEDATNIIRAHGGWRWVPRAAVAIGVALFATNLAICTVWQDWSYAFDRVCVRPAATRPELPSLAADSDCRFVNLDRRVTIPKWDTDIEEHPSSWWTGRIWVLLLGYVWIPIAGAKLFLIIVGTGRYVASLAAEDGALTIDPASPGRGVGFAHLTSLSTAFVYPLAVLALMLAMQFVKEGLGVSWHNWLLLAASVPLLLFAFLYPQWGLSLALDRAKAKALRRYSTLFSEVNEQLLAAAADPTGSDADLGKLRAGVDTIKDSYEWVASMSVWPFERSALYRVVSASLAPFIVPVLKALFTQAGWLA